MECVLCSGDTKVIDVRKRDGRHYRRRECVDCGERFTTYEINQVHLFNVLENYLPLRLIDEISKSVAKGYPERGKNTDIME